EMFPSFGGNVRHGEPCYVNGQSFMCMGYFRTYSYAKATGMSRWVLDFMARRELLLEGKEREASPEAAALAQALRGLKPLKMFLTTFVRNTTCVNEVMRIVKTQGLSAASIHACQERLGD